MDVWLGDELKTFCLSHLVARWRRRRECEVLWHANARGTRAVSLVDIANLLCRNDKFTSECATCFKTDQRYGSEPNQHPSLPVDQGRQVTSSVHLRDRNGKSSKRETRRGREPTLGKPWEQGGRVQDHRWVSAGPEAGCCLRSPS